MEINIHVNLNQNVQVSLEIDDVIEEINNMPLSQRMNIVGKLLNETETENSELLDEHRKIIITYLKKQITFFENGKS